MIPARIRDDGGKIEMEAEKGMFCIGLQLHLDKTASDSWIAGLFFLGRAVHASSEQGRLMVCASMRIIKYALCKVNLGAL